MPEADEQGSTVSAVKRRQRKRQHQRRQEHHRAASQDRPRDVLDRDSYPEVKKAHIVPQMYQRAWSVAGSVNVHVDGAEQCVSMNVRNAGVRSRFYRRDRPDGSSIDDVEASLSEVEGAAAIPLGEIIGGEPLTMERKAVLAQFFAVQLLRGPAFFEQREDLLSPMLDALTAADLKPSAVARHGSVQAVKTLVRGAYLGSTQRLLTMLTTSKKMAVALGDMRWHLLRADRPLLAFSDHPIVVWPMTIERTEPLSRQELGPLGAIEVRVPLAPELAILMTWVDLPDPAMAARMSQRVAAELNAFTVGQANRQWMHRPGDEPPLALGSMLPLSRIYERGYSPELALASQRRLAAQQFLQRVQARQHIDDIELVDVKVPAGAQVE